MHEFSLASEIVEISTKAARNAQKNKITQITLQIGELSGVEVEALLTALDSLCRQSILSTASIEIEKVSGKAICTECGKAFTLSDIFKPCPYCLSLFKDITGGKEFNVLSIVAE